MTKNFFITVDGPDGAGKGTVISYIEQELKANDIEYVIVKGFGSGTIGETLRSRVIADDFYEPERPLLFAMGQLDAYREIKDALGSGKAVIADRWLATYYSYQVFTEKTNIAKAIFDDLFLSCYVAGTEPDLSVSVSTDLETAQKRIRARYAEDAVESYDAMSASFFDSVLQGNVEYHRLAGTLDSKQLRIVNVGTLSDLEKMAKEGLRQKLPMLYF